MINGIGIRGGLRSDGNEMKFVRRKDLSEWVRLWLAVAMEFRSDDDHGMVTDLAAKHDVSRQFLYSNRDRYSRQIVAADRLSAEPDDDFIHRLILSLRLHCNGSIDGIVKTFDEMGWRPGSAGYVSQFLNAVGGACEIDVPQGVEPVVLMLDETFSRRRPILVVMEASSHCILSIVLADDRRAVTWEAELKRLQKLGMDIALLVKDQGSSLKAAAESMGLPERVDLFHLMKPFDPFLPCLERRAYGAIAEESERERILCNRKTDDSFAKALERYEEAAGEARKAVRNFDDYDYLHHCLHESFDSFTAEGRIRNQGTAQRDIDAVLDLIMEKFRSNAKIVAAVKFIRGNLDDYWSYFSQLENTVEKYADTIPEYALLAVCIAWQLNKKSMAVKGSKQKNSLGIQSREWMAFALAGASGRLKTDIGNLLKELDANIRSSSPLEAVNSVIRAKLNACRGQLTPETLKMIAFHINHQKATRGKYAGTSPYERLTGRTEDKSSIRKLLESYAGSESKSDSLLPIPSQNHIAA